MAQGGRQKCCVACGGESIHKEFSKLVLKSYQADYFECTRCGTLQIANVHWLDEAYGNAAVDIDTGAAQRSVMCSLLVRSLRLAGLVKRSAMSIDFGAGSGLLVRLLRDQGLDAHGFDKFTEMALCRQFRIEELPADGGLAAELITAFEVFEHVLSPADTLGLLRRNLSPRGMVLLTTGLYDSREHGPDWDYLSPQHGQHINFFSRQGLTILAEAFGLKALFLPFGFHLLLPPDTTVGFVRRTMIGLLAAAQFAVARTLGLCNFRHALRDNQALAEQTIRRP